MTQSDNASLGRAILILSAFHILVIAASNYLVQIPVQILGMHTTWGTFTFPLVYLASDLTVRIFGQVDARRIVYRAMLPALIVSYLVSVLFYQGVYQGAQSLETLNTFVLRIALASFLAYALGQLLDIKVFAHLRRNPTWWIAPAASTILGNLLDTAVFYSLAFWRSSDAFMATHWPEIAALDYTFKIVVSLLLFVPAYGLLLRFLADRITASADNVPDPQAVNR